MPAAAVLGRFGSYWRWRALPPKSVLTTAHAQRAKAVEDGGVMKAR